MTQTAVSDHDRSPFTKDAAPRARNGLLVRLRRIGSMMILFLLVVFILPALAHIAVWQMGDHPSSWRSANWGSAGILPASPPRDSAEIMVLDARTGGLKGALSVHSWLVLKLPGETRYRRYDVVGWGNPVRENNYAADARWYSNEPVIRHRLSCPKAERYLPLLRAAIADYRFARRGDYTIWPGPNSNSFVADVLRAAPGLSMDTSPVAVGRDFRPSAFLGVEDGSLRGSLWGYAGFAIGRHVGFELNFLGLVTGFDPGTLTLSLPGFGEFGPYRVVPPADESTPGRVR